MNFRLLNLLLIIVSVNVFGGIEDLDKITQEAIQKIDISEMAKDYDQHLINIIDKLDPNAKNYVGYLIEYYYLANRNACLKTIEKIKDLLKDIDIKHIQNFLLIFCKSANPDSLEYLLDFDSLVKYNGQFVCAIDFWRNKILRPETRHKRQLVQIWNSIIKQYNEYDIRCY